MPKTLQQSKLNLKFSDRFLIKKASNHMPRGWYSYNNNVGANKFLSTNYDSMTIKPVCEDGTDVCAIYAYYAIAPKPLHPAPFEAGSQIRDYLSNVPASLSAQPVGSSKKYLYLFTPTP